MDSGSEHVTRLIDETNDGQTLELGFASISQIQKSLFRSTSISPYFIEIPMENGPPLQVVIVSATSVYRDNCSNAAGIPTSYSVTPDFEMQGWTLDVGRRSIPRVVEVQLEFQSNPGGGEGTVLIRRKAIPGSGSDLKGHVVASLSE